MNIVTSKDLEYEYKFYNDEMSQSSFKALKGVNMEIEEGNFVAVLGHNGSGKSTFAKNINGLLVPSGGTLLIYDKSVAKEENIWDIRSQVGMIFQNPDNQIVSAIVEDDVAFGLENLGVPSAEIRKRVDESLKWTGLTKFKDASPNQLSGGQKQRVAIAGILAMRPKCIVLDEPTAMLDPIGRKEIIEQIIRLNKEENITIILITHFMEEAILADKIYVMEDGEVVLEGTPKKVFNEVETLKGFGLDVPLATEISYKLQKKGINIDNVLSIEELVDKVCQLKLKT